MLSLLFLPHVIFLFKREQSVGFTIEYIAFFCETHVSRQNRIGTQHNTQYKKHKVPDVSNIRHFVLFNVFATLALLREWQS